MTFFMPRFVTAYLLGFVFICAALPSSLRAQSFAAAQRDTAFKSLQHGNWIAGFSGLISTTNRNLTFNNERNSVLEIRYTINTRTGYFIADRLTLGLDFELSNTETSTSPNPNPQDVQEKSSTESLFVGPWIRYYFKLAEEWAVFPELSIGYSAINGINETRIRDVLQSGLETTGKGYGAKLGIGFTYFLTRNIGFDITARYSVSRLTGNALGESLIVLQAEGSVLIGFQLYLNEFFF
jgi:hypothetical protein